MKRFTVLFLMLGVLGLTSCIDLTIDNNAPTPFAIDWSTKYAIANIINKGNEKAGEFFVYLEISDPASPESARPESQATVRVPYLSPNQSYPIKIRLDKFSVRSFDPTTGPPALLEVRIDAKGMVKEVNENNNYFEGVF